MWKKAISLLMLLKLEMCLKELHKAQELKKRFKMSRKKKEKKKEHYLSYNLHTHAHVLRSKPRVDHTPYVHVVW